MKEYEFEVRVVVFRRYLVEGEDESMAKDNFFSGRGRLLDEDEDIWEITRMEEIDGL